MSLHWYLRPPSIHMPDTLVPVTPLIPVQCHTPDTLVNATLLLSQSMPLHFHHSLRVPHHQTFSIWLPQTCHEPRTRDMIPSTGISFVPEGSTRLCCQFNHWLNVHQPTAMNSANISRCCYNTVINFISHLTGYVMTYPCSDYYIVNPC